VARLLSDACGSDLPLDRIEAAWAEGERLARRRQHALSGAAAACALGAALSIWHFAGNAARAARDADAEAQLQRSRVLADQGGPALPSALAYAASAIEHGSGAPAVAAAMAAMQELVPIRRLLRPDGGDPAWTCTFVSGSLLAAGGRSGVLRLVDTGTGEVAARIDLGASEIRQIAYDPSTGSLFVGTDKGVVRLALDLEGPSARLRATGRALGNRKVGGLAIDAGRGRVLVGLLQDGAIWSFPLAAEGQWSGRRETAVTDPRFAEDGASDMPSGIYGLGLSGGDVVAVGIDGVISVFRDGALQDAPRQLAHPRSIFAMAVSRRGRELAVADQDGGLAVYGLEALELRRAEAAAASPAGVAPGLDGKLAAVRVDKQANVGLAISPDDGIVAVTSQDRTVRFLSFSDLSPLGLAVHRAAPRGVAFASAAEAVTVADDGAMQVVRPSAQPETLRLAGVGRFAPSRDGRVLIWPLETPAPAGLYRGPGVPRLHPYFDAGPGTGSARELGELGALPSEAIAVAGGYVAFRPAQSAVAGALGPDGKPRCEALRKPGDAGAQAAAESLAEGPESGTVATVTRGGASGTGILDVWDLSTCAALRSWPTSGAAASAPGATATVAGASSVEVRATPGYVPEAVAFERPVRGLSLAHRGASVLALLEGLPGACLCSKGRGRPPRSDACRTGPGPYACRSVDAPPAGPGGPQHLSAAFFSPSGRYAVAQGPARLLLGAQASGWTFQPVGPGQPAAGPPAYAFSADEGLLAVPAGATGARLLDPATGGPVAEFPTPGRVTRLAFTSGPGPLLATLDGSILRLWDWRPGSIKALVCERWNPEVSVEELRGVAPALGREAFCRRE